VKIVRLEVELFNRGNVAKIMCKTVVVMAEGPARGFSRRPPPLKLKGAEARTGD